MSHKMVTKNLGVVLLAVIAAISAAFLIHRHFVAGQYGAQTEETRKLARTIDIQVIDRLRGAAVATARAEWVGRTAAGELGVDNPETLLILETTRSIFNAAIVYIMNAKGDVVACTPFAEGQTLTGKSYEFRPYFIHAMQGQSVLYPALGVTTHERGLYTSAPVYRRSDQQQPTGVLVIKSGLDPIDQMLGEYREPLAMLSPEGVVFAANRPDWLFRLSRQTLTETERMRLRESRQFADQSLEGLPGGLNLVEGVTPIDGQRHGVVRVPIGITSSEGLSWELLSLRTYPASSLIGLMLAVIATIAIITIVVLLYLSSRRAGAELTREVSANREYLATILNSIGDAVIAVDTREVIRHMNPAGERLTGWSLAEATGKPLEEVFRIVDTRTREPAVNPVTLVLATGDVTRLSDQTELVARDGTERQIADSAAPIRDSGGNITGVVLVFSEVTEMVAARQALQASEASLQGILQSTADGILAVSKENRVLFANESFVEMWMIPKKIMDSGDDAALIQCVLDQLTDPQSFLEKVKKLYASNEESFDTLHFKDGRAFDRLSRPMMQGAELRGRVWSFRDITERKRAEEALRNSEEDYRRLFQESKRAAELYRSLLESSADAIVIYDLEGNVRFASPSFTRIFGWTLDDLVGKRTPFVPEAEQEATMAEIRRVLAGDHCSNFETRRYDKNGRILNITLSASRYDDHEGVPAGMLVILRDITQTKALEAQYRQAQKMEAIGTLAGGIAHDFNNILQAITGYTQLLLWGKSGDDSGRHELMQIEKAGERATQLVRQLLTFSRKVEGERRPLNLNQEVLEVEKVVRRTIPKMIAIELRLGSRLWGIHADPVQIEQILLNLVSNAADAMPEEGTLVIETRNAILDDEYCRDHLGAIPGNYVLLSASDTGHGMDRETLQHIFEPFFTTKEIGKGTGLGLASVYGIVKSHGGYIECSSEVGKGSTFEIYLPSIGHVDALAGKETDATSMRGGSETILVVDDEASVRGLATQTLQRLGYKVLAAHSGESALAIYRAHKGRIDLVILDLGMPGMGGHRCLRELKKIDPEARVVIASGYSDSSQEKASLESGALGFIGKPYELKELAVQVRKFLDREQGQ